MDKDDHSMTATPETDPAQARPEPNRRGRLHATAVETLRTMIVSGRIAPGVSLRETELCHELGISRTPLREAIRTLAREGLVRLAPNRSAIAAGLDYEEIKNLYEAISGLEAQAAMMTIERASDENLDEIRALHHQMMVHYLQRDLPKYIQLNMEIHRCVVRLSRNSVLLELWDMLLPRVERARTSANLHASRWHAAVHEHENILQALMNRDAAGFSDLIRQHYFNGLAALKAVDEGKSDRTHSE
jgi:DNA-binding GntR family transcriptional regulator